jgi:hypothetical protein
MQAGDRLFRSVEQLAHTDPHRIDGPSAFVLRASCDVGPNRALRDALGVEIIKRSTTIRVAKIAGWAPMKNTQRSVLNHTARPQKEDRSVATGRLEEKEQHLDTHSPEW